MAPNKPIRGLTRNQEVRPGLDRVDFRRPSEKFRDWMVESQGGPMLLLTVLATMAVFPVLLEPLFVVGMVLMYWLGHQKFHLPLRMPQSSGLLDHNDPAPTTYAPRPAGGIVFLGNEMGTGKELWVNASDAGTHFLVFGTTGAGKAILDDAWVHTPKGWVQAHQVVEGQQVSTVDGHTSKVVGVYPQGVLALYTLILDDGRTVEVSGDHLWEVHPYTSHGPLQAGPALQRGEVIRTLELQDRLKRRDWGSAEGLALPLPEAPEAPAAAWTDGVKGQMARWRAAMTEGTAWPEAGDEGDRSQRQALWKALMHEGVRQGWCTTFGRCRRVEAAHGQTMQALVRLARSLGFWARLNDDGSVWVQEQQRLVQVLHVRSSRRSASCRCFKIEDPRGLFLMDDYVVTHNTEALVSMAYNALVQGSGFIYVDGKGDNSLFMKLFSLARVAGREDDLLCINYMTGGRDVIGAQEDKPSNSMNPFTVGSAGSLTQLLVSLMPSGGGDNAMWQGRAVSFIGSLMMALTYLRDTGQIRLGVGQIRDNLTLEKVQELAKRTDLPARIIEALQSYLKSLPGYQENPKDGQQGEITTEQHGYLQMQFTRVMSSLADDYGYIFNTTRGEVDFLDVVLNNRILAVLLPSLEKSPEELGNLGKIIVASLKSMMATGLGDRIEGATAETIDAKATTAPNPFLVILDEYGYYVVAGAAVMPAQARSLNFSMVFAGQDFPSFKKNNNKEEAEATAANCNVYVFMKLRDTTDTAELFSKAAGKARVARISGYNRNSGGMGNSYFDNQNAAVQEEERGSILDLSDQLQGEAHIIFKSAVVRAVMFYAAPPKPKYMRLNHFLRVESPTSAEMASFAKKLEDLQAKFARPETLDEWTREMPLPQALAVASNTLAHCLDQHQAPEQAALAGLMAAYRLPYANADAFSQASQRLGGAEPLDDDDPGINVFTTDHEMELRRPEGGARPKDSPVLSAPRPRLDRTETESALMQAEMAGGADPRTALQRAQQNISDLEATTHYPNKDSIPEMIDEASFVDNVLLGLEQDLEDPDAAGAEEDDV